MEAFVLLGAALAASCAGWIALGSGHGSEALASARVELTRRRLLRVASSFGSSGALERAGGVGWVREAVSVVLARRSGALRGLDEPGARAVLVVLWLGLVGLGLLASGPAGGVVLGAAALVAAPAWGASRAKARADGIARQVPGMFRSLAVALGSGRTLAQAISYVATRGTGELAREFGRASLMVSCGVSAQEALGELAQRTRAPGVDLMVCAVVVSLRTGAPLQGLFLRSARLAERRFELERELMGKTAQVRLSARIVSALPVGLVCVLALLSPDFRAGLATPVGTGSVVVAAVLDALALLVIRRLMKGVL